MSAVIILQQMVIVFLLVMTGYYITKKGIISSSAGPLLSAIVVNVVNPALMLMSAWNKEGEPGSPKLLQAALMGLGLYLLLILLGWVIPFLMRTPKAEQAYYNMMTIFGNVGFIGLPLAAAVLGDEGMIYVIVINVYYSLFVYTYGVYLIAKCGKEQKEMEGFQPKKLLNIGMVSGLLSIILYIWKPDLPVILTSGVEYIGKSSTFLCMLVIGISLSQMSLRTLFLEKRLYLFILIRQILVPVLLGLLLNLVIQDKMACKAVVLMAGMPVGNMPLMMAENKEIDGTLFAKGTLLTTIASIGTIPLAVLFV